jgi:hypothetical protein
MSGRNKRGGVINVASYHQPLACLQREEKLSGRPGTILLSPVVHAKAT